MSVKLVIRRIFYKAGIETPEYRENLRGRPYKPNVDFSNLEYLESVKHLTGGCATVLRNLDMLFSLISHLEQQNPTISFTGSKLQFNLKNYLTIFGKKDYDSLKSGFIKYTEDGATSLTLYLHFAVQDEDNSKVNQMPIKPTIRRSNRIVDDYAEPFISSFDFDNDVDLTIGSRTRANTEIKIEADFDKPRKNSNIARRSTRSEEIRNRLNYLTVREPFDEEAAWILMENVLDGQQLNKLVVPESMSLLFDNVPLSHSVDVDDNVSLMYLPRHLVGKVEELIIKEEQKRGNKTVVNHRTMRKMRKN